MSSTTQVGLTDKGICKHNVVQVSCFPSELTMFSKIYCAFFFLTVLFPLPVQRERENVDERHPVAVIGHFEAIVTFQFSSVQSLSRVQLFATPWIAARQGSLSITNSRSSLRFTSIESVIPSSHLILCRPLLLPSVPPSIRVFSNESTLPMRWPKYWSFSF